MTKNRYVRLSSGKSRLEARNVGTTCAKTATRSRPAAYRRHFLANYEQIAIRCRRFDAPGIAIAAVHEETGQLAGLACIAAKIDSPTLAIVGRHERSDLYLGGCPSLALRHLAVVIEPPASWEKGRTELHYRVLDLQTRDGFVDETGQSLRSLSSEGPAMLRAGDHALYFLQLGDPSDWPASAEDAWSFLPERVYFDEVTRFAQASQRIPIQCGVGRITHVTRIGPAVSFQRGLLDDGEAPVAHLEVRTARGMIRLSVGEGAIDRGILIGRYERCAPGASHLDDTVSRVHLLLLRTGNEIYAFDVCSTNGTWHPQIGQATVFRPGRASSLRLGLDDTYARWWCVK